MTVAQAHPADARRQSLELDARPRHVEPGMKMPVVGHQLLHLGVRPVDVLRIAGQRGPAERPDAAAEQGPDIGRHEAGVAEGVRHALLQRHLADVVAVVDGRHAEPVELQHGAHVARHRLFGRLGDGGRIAAAPGFPLGQRPAPGQVAVDRIVRGGLVGETVGPHAAAQQFGQHVGGITEQRYRDRLVLRRRLADDRERIVQVLGLDVDIAGAQTELDAAGTAFDGEARGAGHGRGHRLRAAHAAEACGQDPATGQAAAVMLTGHLDEGFVGALHDALAADVDPGARRHLAEHHQALAVEFVEMLPGGPARHEIGIGDQDARRVGMGAEHPDRLARLDQQRLVGFELAKCCHDAVEALPVARRAADAAIDHQLAGLFGDVGIEVVHEHAERRFGQPALRRKFRAAWGANNAGIVDAGHDGVLRSTAGRTSRPTLSTIAPPATKAVAFLRSGWK